MADSLARSYEAIDYLLNNEAVAPADEDVAWHLISFSLDKIIFALQQLGVISGASGYSGDLGLRQRLRQFYQVPTADNLLNYLLQARRAGLDVFQIDEGAWLSALDLIMQFQFARPLQSILLFDQPLDFLQYRQRIRENYPESDILVDAQESYTSNPDDELETGIFDLPTIITEPALSDEQYRDMRQEIIKAVAKSMSKEMPTFQYNYRRALSQALSDAQLDFELKSLLSQLAAQADRIILRRYS